MFDLEDFGERVKKLRGNESRESFGRKYGNTASWVSYLENGKRMPQVPFLIQFCNDYGVSMDYIIRGQNYKIENLHEPAKLLMREFCISLRKIQADLDNAHEKLLDNKKTA